MLNACILGMGVVGKATASVFGIKDYFDLKGSTITLEQAAKKKFIFICLPTPTKDKSCDISAIEGIVKQIAGYGCGGIIIIRSTVIPGTARHLMEKYDVPIVSNPEFLSEDTALADAKNPDLVVIGSENFTYLQVVRGLYESRFKGVNIFGTDTITAEMVKYAMNSFFVTKVVFANEIFDLCQRVGANYEAVKHALYTHRFGPRNHFDIFHKLGRGAGGKCLPKDIAAFANYSQSGLLFLVETINQKLLSESNKHYD